MRSGFVSFGEKTEFWHFKKRGWCEVGAALVIQKAKAVPGKWSGWDWRWLLVHGIPSFCLNSSSSQTIFLCLGEPKWAAGHTCCALHLLYLLLQEADFMPLYWLKDSLTFHFLSGQVKRESGLLDVNISISEHNYKINFFFWLLSIPLKKKNGISEVAARCFITYRAKYNKVLDPLVLGSLRNRDHLIFLTCWWSTNWDLAFVYNFCYSVASGQNKNKHCLFSILFT